MPWAVWPALNGERWIAVNTTLLEIHTVFKGNNLSSMKRGLGTTTRLTIGDTPSPVMVINAAPWYTHS